MRDRSPEETTLLIQAWGWFAIAAMLIIGVAVIATKLLLQSTGVEP